MTIPATAGELLAAWASTPAPAEARLVAPPPAAAPVRRAPAGLPQAQGDLIVLPWPASIGARDREREVLLARPLAPGTGVTLLRSHRLLPLEGDARWTPWQAFGAATLGTLVVPDGATALLEHDEHDDLFIGRGVYVLRRQRVWTRPVPDAQHYQPAPD